jgi:hypothetical protein
MADATNLHRKPLAAIRCRDAARVEIDCDGTARYLASLDAALDVRYQASKAVVEKLGGRKLKFLGWCGPAKATETIKRHAL